jgi:NAD(P)-dependent dehydrogenase (short-subunit alcohol dehydrogenase family)
MEIEGKRGLVTGASKDLGCALALAVLGLARREVLAGARQLESLENLRETARDVPLTWPGSGLIRWR